MKRELIRQTARVSACLLLLTALASVSAAAGGWQIQTVDTTGAGEYNSLKIDKDGNAHLAYAADDGKHSVRYAFWDHRLNKWFTMTVATGGQFTSMVLDSRLRPHISWVDFGTGVGARIHYARWDGASWKTEPIGQLTGASLGYYTSIALDRDENPIISYYDYAAPGGSFILRLRVYWRNDNVWEVRTVDPVLGSGKFNSIATDSAGNPHIAYANVGAMNEGLRYASWNGHSWDIQILEGANGAVPMYSVNLVLDKNDSPHIAYMNMLTHQAKYAFLSGGKWRLEVVDSLELTAYPDRNGITVDDQGNPYLSYYDSGMGVLKVAHRSAEGKWTIEVVDDGFSGFTSSIQIQGGDLVVAYTSVGTLKVARRPLNPGEPPANEATHSAKKSRP